MARRQPKDVSLMAILYIAPGERGGVPVLPLPRPDDPVFDRGPRGETPPVRRREVPRPDPGLSLWEQIVDFASRVWENSNKGGYVPGPGYYPKQADVPASNRPARVALGQKENAQGQPLPLPGNLTYCFGADEWLCGWTGIASPACRAAANLTCLTLGVFALIALLAVATAALIQGGK